MFLWYLHEYTRAEISRGVSRVYGLISWPASRSIYFPCSSEYRPCQPVVRPPCSVRDRTHRAADGWGIRCERDGNDTLSGAGTARARQRRSALAPAPHVAASAVTSLPVRSPTAPARPCARAPGGAGVPSGGCVAAAVAVSVRLVDSDSSGNMAFENVFPRPTRTTFGRCDLIVAPVRQKGTPYVGTTDV
jgi:hypothetical protein